LLCPALITNGFTKAGWANRAGADESISQTIADFRNKSLGLIPNEYLSPFSETLENFLPIYRELIFEPNKAALEVQKNNLLHYSKKQPVC